MVFDTASEWTVVMNKNGKGNQLPANYDPTTSVTRKNVLQEDKELTQTVNLGGVIFSGPVKTEYMCVHQWSDFRSFATGRTCVDGFEFISATSQIGEMNSNGVIGMAPTGSANSFVEQLKRHA
jgi:hypothetical protein